MSTVDSQLSRGFDSGNYCNAYETHDLGKAFETRDVESKGDAYKTAFIMAFFGSYELNEIPGIYRPLFDEAYHSELGQRVLELGYTERRDADYAAEQDAGKGDH